jgi:hypothetical protein
MLKPLFLLLLLGLSATVMAQDDSTYWARWNAGYRPTDVGELLSREQRYADSIEHQSALPGYYARFDKYRFTGEFTGETRKIDPDVMRSMQHVFKLYVGSGIPLDSLVSSEVLFNVNGTNLWMPVQNEILAALREEVSKGEQLTLYCAFLNEHSEKNRLTNAFLISEYKK